jgi:predicted dehydrogenase
MSVALLIGYGSIGKRHLNELLRRFESVHIVDSKFQASSERSAFDVPRTKTFKSISELPAAQSYGLAVIATWGPTHLQITESVLTQGAKFILLEKPVESSLAKVDQLEALIESYRVPAAVNFSLRYGPLMQLMNNLISLNTVGQLCNIIVSGGAKCIATNGIHYLDFFMQILNENPTGVISRITNSSINPRSKDLAYLEGITSFEFSKNRQLTINFSNKSFAHLGIEIIFERARLWYSNSVIELWGTDNTSLFPSRPTNRSIEFDKLIGEYHLENEDVPDGIAQLYNKILQNPDDFQISNFTESTRQIIRSCIASKKRCEVNSLVVLEKSFYEMDWKIS